MEMKTQQETIKNARPVFSFGMRWWNFRVTGIAFALISFAWSTGVIMIPDSGKQLLIVYGVCNLSCLIAEAG